MNSRLLLYALAVLAAAAAAALITQRNAQASDSEPEAEQGATLFDDAMTAIDPSTYTTPDVTPTVAQANTRAFLDMTAWSEGTSGYPDGGYRTLFGGDQFDSYADHPRRAAQFTDQAGRTLWTTAAGRYQFMAVSPIPGTDRSTKVDTWDRLKAKLQLPDFSPASQDAAAIELIRERGALGDVMAGRLSDAVAKCASIWASLPGAGYSQRERRMDALRLAFGSAGGITTEA